MSQLNVFSSSPQKASNIIGSKVVNPTGDTLGDIKEIVIDQIGRASCRERV